MQQEITELLDGDINLQMNLLVQLLISMNFNNQKFIDFCIRGIKADLDSMTDVDLRFRSFCSQ
ncbi:hypothetical protein ACVWYN_001683 [Pedobacter sp. UYP24]